MYAHIYVHVYKVVCVCRSTERNDPGPEGAGWREHRREQDSWYLPHGAYGTFRKSAFNILMRVCWDLQRNTKYLEDKP